MITVPNYEAKIWLGFRKGYTHGYNNMGDLSLFLRKWCTDKKMGVSVTPTQFFYVNGDEPGAVLGLINYPRYPETLDQIKNKALELAEALKEKFSQYRVSITFNPSAGETIMLGDV